MSLNEPLPNIPIPLRRGEREVVLQMQPLLDACYRDGRYASLDFRVPPEPPLEDDLAAWADQLLRGQGRR